MGGVVSMKELITTFLESNNFNRIEDTDINLFTNRLKSEYFIIHENSVEELVNYFNLEKSNAVIERFTTLTTSKRLENILFQKVCHFIHRRRKGRIEGNNKQ